MELSLEHGIDVPMRRPVPNFGDPVYPELPTATIRVAYSLGRPQRDTADAGGMKWSQTGRLYVYRGTDITDGDKVTLPEGDYVVTGPAQNDMLNPLDGNNFGVKRFEMVRG